MSLTKDRFLGRYIHPDALVVAPKTLVGVDSLVDGQIVPVTDQPGVNLMIRKGGTLKPAVLVREASSTTSWIEMTVDPTAGTSPPAGTLVHNQAEYDALGYDLLYAQDALDILPLILRYGVIIKLKGGAHAGKYARTGGDNGYDQWLYFPDFLVDTAEAYYGDLDGREPGIYIEGEGENDIGSPVACTWDVATTQIVRTAGTWTVDEHAGRLVLITSGVLAGMILPVYGNDATSLAINSIQGSGTYPLTIQVYEPAAVVSGMTSLLTATPNDLRAQFPITLGLRNVKLVSSYDMTWHGYLNLQYCMAQVSRLVLRHALPYDGFGGSAYQSTIQYSSVRLPGSGYARLAVLAGGLSVESSAIRGNISGGPDIPLVYLVAGALHSISSIYGPTYEASPTIDGPIFKLSGGQVVGGNYNTLAGNGLTTGVLLDGGDLIYGGSALAWAIRDQAVAIATGVNKRGTVTGLHPDSTGNTKGWVVSGGSHVHVEDPSVIAASGDELAIDGTVYPYADIPSAGDWIEGPSGSRIVR